MAGRKFELGPPSTHVKPWPRFTRKAGESPTDVSKCRVRAPTAIARRVVEEALRVAAAIHDARVARGWTRRDLAEEAGVSVQTLGNIEHGRGLPDFATLAAVAEALQVDLTVHAHSVLPARTQRQIEEDWAVVKAEQAAAEAARRAAEQDRVAAEEERRAEEAERLREQREREAARRDRQFERETAAMDPLPFDEA